MLERLPVPARGGGRPRGRRSEPRHGVAVAGAARVVRQPRRVRAPRLLERMEHHPIQLVLPDRRDLVLDRPPREVVAERERTVLQGEQARVDAGVDRRGRRARGLRQQPQLRRAGNDGGQLDHGARVGTERGDAQSDRLAHARRHRGAGGRRQRFGDEERVAARHAVQIRGLPAGPLRQHRDRLLRQRRRLDPPRALAAQRPEYAPDLGQLSQRVGAAGHDQAAARARQPPPKQGHEVERRVVRPVQVLDHEHRGRARGQLVERRRQDVLARTTFLDRRGNRTADLPRDVQQRPHRARRDERIARAPEHAPRVGPRDDGGDQRRLADAGLARDDHDPPLGPRLVDRRL